MAEIVNFYPVGVQTFEVIRNEDYLYIDKTQYIADFRRKKMKYVFLSRPRRFGKSLFASTLQAYFEGRKELFEGLAIADYEKEWVKHPVLHFDMSGAKHSDAEDLKGSLDYLLRPYEKIYGRGEGEDTPNKRLEGVVKRAYEKTGEKAVVIIDEYDAPLLDVVHEEENLNGLRFIMRNFYSPLKKLDPYLEFTFITGITKFSQLSIFSELNNIKNISMDEPFAGICGITKEELLTQMNGDIDALARKLGVNRDEAIMELKDHYDGYHFCWPSPDVFNPYSLINCFADGKLEAYWFSSGTPTYLINMMRKFDCLPSSLTPKSAKASAFDAPTESMKAITPLLYQSGYVTIKGYDAETDVYTLDLPNKEIRVALFESMLPYYLDEYADDGDVAVARMSALIKRGRMDEALQLLADFLETVPYCDNTRYEGHWQQTFYIVFALLTGYGITVEQHTAKGRIDISLETKTAVYVMELKFNKSVDEALVQIEAKRYADAFKMKNKEIVKVGLNFGIKDDVNCLEWKTLR